MSTCLIFQKLIDPTVSHTCSQVSSLSLHPDWVSVDFSYLLSVKVPLKWRILLLLLFGKRNVSCAIIKMKLTVSYLCQNERVHPAHGRLDVTYEKIAELSPIQATKPLFNIAPLNAALRRTDSVKGSSFKQIPKKYRKSEEFKEQLPLFKHKINWCSHYYEKQ